MKCFFIILILISYYNLSFAEEKERKRLFVDITDPNIKKLPLAIIPFTNLGKKTNKKVLDGIKKTLEFDLEVSGLFKTIPEKAFLIKNIDIKNFDPKNWKILGTNGVVATHYIFSAKTLTLEFRLFDVASGMLVLGKRYTGNTNDYKIMAHKFIDQILAHYTGEPGMFTTKVVFVSNKTGNKEIYVMDWDGTNISPITSNKSINLSPSWSHDNSKIVYVSYKSGAPELWLVNLKNMKHNKLTSTKGLNVGPCWLPDNKHVVFASKSPRKSGGTDLYILNVHSKNKIRITNMRGIEISPSVSPDGKKFAFVSSKVGPPHIFTMNIDGSSMFRITYAGRYNASPTWSPKGKKIVFAGWDKDHFDLFMVNANATNMERLTKYSKDNEEPCFSPDGRHIMFQSTRRSKKGSKKSDLFLINSNGLGERPILIDFGEASSPAWSNRF